MRHVLIPLALLTLATMSTTSSASQQPAPRAVAINLDLTGSGYTPVLNGPPTTAGMRSGYVVLAPGASVGRHSTEGNEEVVVVLGGVGELRLAKQAPLPLREGTVAYNPPHTEHDVANTGTAPLRYLYVVAPAVH